MKNVVRSILYLIIVLLVLELIKTLVAKVGGTSSFFTGIVLASLQMFILTEVILFSLIYKLIKKRIMPPRKAVGFALFFTLVIIGCLEGLFAMWLHHPERLPAFLSKAYEQYYNTYDRKIIQFDGNASVYSPQLFYTLKPNAHFRFVNAEFNTAYTTNSLGVRDDDSSLHKPAIISMGDSHCMGWGVEQDSTYSQCLERLSHQKVLNTGISSYGTAREISGLHRFDKSAVTYLVVQYCDNDVEENTDYLKNSHVLKISPREVYDKTVNSEKINSTYFPGKHFLNISQIFIKQQINKVVSVFPYKTGKGGQEVASNSQAKWFLEVLGDAPVNFTRCKVIVLFPGKLFDRSKAFETALEAMLHQPPFRERFGDNVRVLKVSELLQSDDYFILDDHLKNSGHRKIAEGIWKMIHTF